MHATPEADHHEVTVLLNKWCQGDREAGEALVPVLYGELKKIAAAYLARGRTRALDVTELVDEAFVRLIDRNALTGFENRTHFFGICARLMREVLVDQVRRATADKRGGQVTLLTLDEDLDGRRQADLLYLDEALTALARVHPRRARLTELRFFAGLTTEEASRVMDVSVRTLKREWQAGRVWLARYIHGKQTYGF